MMIAAHTTNMDDDGNGLDDEDGAVVQRRYSVSPIQWTKAMYKGNTVEINGDVTIVTNNKQTNKGI